MLIEQFFVFTLLSNRFSGEYTFSLFFWNDNNTPKQQNEALAMNDSWSSRTVSEEFPLRVRQEYKESKAPQTSSNSDIMRRRNDMSTTAECEESDSDDDGYLARKRRRKERKLGHKKHRSSDESDGDSKLVPVAASVPCDDASSIVAAVFHWFVATTSEMFTANRTQSLQSHGRHHHHHHHHHFSHHRY